MDDKTLVLKREPFLQTLSRPLVWIGGIGIGLLLALLFMRQGEGRPVSPSPAERSIEVSRKEYQQAQRLPSERKEEKATVASEEAIEEIKKQPASTPLTDQSRGPASHQGPRSVTVPPSTAPSVQTGLLLYRQGKVQGAIALLTEITRTNPGKKGETAKEYITIIHKIRDRYETGLHFYQSGQTTNAFAEWKELMDQERHIIKGGETSWYGRRIARYAADEYHKRGHDHYTRGNFTEALIEWQKALKADPAHPEALEGMKKLTAIARQIYREGYILEEIDIEEAMEKWREVLKIVPPEEEYYKKAEEKLRTRIMNK